MLHRFVSFSELWCKSYHKLVYIILQSCLIWTCSTPRKLYYWEAQDRGFKHKIVPPICRPSPAQFWFHLLSATNLPILLSMLPARDLQKLRKMPEILNPCRWAQLPGCRKQQVVKRSILNISRLVLDWCLLKPSSYAHTSSSSLQRKIRNHLWWPLLWGCSCSLACPHLEAANPLRNSLRPQRMKSFCEM